MSDIKQKRSRSQKKGASSKRKRSSSHQRTVTKQDTQSMESLISQFNLLFIQEQNKPTEKKLKEFSKEELMAICTKDESKVNYRNFIVFLFKLSGLEMDIEDEDVLSKFVNLKEDSCSEQDTIDDLVESCRIRAAKIKSSKISYAIGTITSYIYNCFDIIREKDYDEFKNFVIMLIKLSQNNYRKIRYLSCLVLCKVFELLYEELNKTSKIIAQKKQSQSENEKSKEKPAITLLSNKKEIIIDMIRLIKEKFIEKKIGDISQNIRVVIADCLTNVSKKSFDLLFSDQKIVRYFPFFLNDPSPAVKLKYLQLIYEKLDTAKEEDSKVLKILIKILSVARDAILDICVKEEKALAKQGLKIVELLSQHKILEEKTIIQLLPHLFNSEPAIRILIAKVVKKYILTFENETEEEEVEDNKDDVDMEGSESKKKTIELKTSDVHSIIEFIHRLTDNKPEQVKVLVDVFFDLLDIFKHIKLFFQYIDQMVASQLDMYFIHTAILVLKFSLEKIQSLIEQGKDESLLSVNEEFINVFISKVSEYIKKFRIPVFENIVNPTQCEILNSLLDLFSYFKIYETNVITFGFESIKDIVSELKNSFFINIVTFAQCEKQKSKNVPVEDPLITNEHILFEKLCDNLLKSINAIISNDILFSFINYKQSKFLSELIYSEDNSSSLIVKFNDILTKELINDEIYKTISSGSLQEVAEKITEFDENTKDKFYIIFTQINYLLIYFKKVFSEFESTIDFFQLSSFLLKTLTINLSSIPEESELDFNCKFNSMILSLVETLHLFIFNNQLDSNNNSDKYIEVRNELINTIFSIISLPYENSNKSYNSFLIQLKTKSCGIFLDMLSYITSESIQKANLRFEITSELETSLCNFFRENFIQFFVEYNRWYKSDIIDKDKENKEDEETGIKMLLNTQKSNFCYQKKESLFTDELMLKTLCFKVLCEKYSRMLLTNFGLFKYIELSSLYFESFFLIKQQKVIEGIASYVFEVILDKEINHFITSRTGEEKDISNSEMNNLTIMIFYLTKITMKLFNNKSTLFSDEIGISYDEKVQMVNHYLNIYSKSYKKLKQKYNTETINIIDKDKNFFENFILNGINFSLETKVPNPEDNTITDIENVYFLEFIKMYLKTNLFLNEADIKNLIIAYLKLAKKIETTDNMNINHIKFMEKFKSYLLNKGKVIISKDEKDNEDDNEDSNESESKEKKKSEVELEEEGSDNEEEKSEEEKGEQELSVEKERSKISTIRKKKKVNKKRNYKESQKAIENEEDFKELTTTKKKKKMKKA